MQTRKCFEFNAFMTPPPIDARGNGNLNGEGNIECQTEEHYKNIKECGFDSLTAIYEYEVAEYLRALELSDRFGFGYLIRDQKGIAKIVEKLGKETDASELLKEYAPQMKKRFDQYAKHRSFHGILAADEPSSDKFPGLKILKDWFNEYYPNKEFEINLLPDYASAEQLTGTDGGEANYEKHLSDFYKIVQPDYFSYDHYALLIRPEDGKKYLRKSYLKNLETVAKYAKNYEIPYKVFLLTLGHWDFRTVSEYREIAWQVYTSMAYGAVGAQTFTYWTILGYPEGNEAHVTTALVGEKGQLMPAWYAMKEVIAEVRSMEKAYLEYRWEYCITALAQGENVLTADLEKHVGEHVRIKNTQTDVVLGCFSKRETMKETGYFLSNITDPADNLSGETVLSFDKEYTMRVWQKGCVRRAEGKEIIVFLRSGEGAFIEIAEK